MFERFTGQARQVVVLAQDEARAFGHAYIGTEHLLLGLLREEEGLAAQALHQVGVSLGAAREQVLASVGPGAEKAGATGQIPFTPRGKRALELALREALALGHNHIGTEHVLLGLLRQGEGVASKVLHALGVDEGAARDEVLDALGSPAVSSGVVVAGRERGGSWPPEEDAPRVAGVGRGSRRVHRPGSSASRGRGRCRCSSPAGSSSRSRSAPGSWSAGRSGAPERSHH